MRIILLVEDRPVDVAVSPGAYERVRMFHRELPTEWMRDGITALDVAKQMVTDTGVDPAAMDEDDFATAFWQAAE